MTRAAALARARALKAHIERFDVAVSIELQPGRSGGWNGLRSFANLGHHVASRRSQGKTPFLALVKRGREDLPGPLANGYLGWDGVARIITLDWANHAGRGGPWRVPGATIPVNNGRPYIFGWECEGGYDWDDWPPWYRRTMAACFAGTLAWMGRDERSHGEHGNPWAPERKPDRLRYVTDLAAARAEIRSLLDGGTPRQEEGDVIRLGDGIEDGRDSPATKARVQAAQQWSNKLIAYELAARDGGRPADGQRLSDMEPLLEDGKAGKITMQRLRYQASVTANLAVTVDEIPTEVVAALVGEALERKQQAHSFGSQHTDGRARRGEPAPAKAG